MQDSLPSFDPALEAPLQTLREVAPRDPQMAAHGRAAFLAQARAAQSARDVQAAASVRAASWPKVLRLASALIGAVVLGSATAVSVAQGSRPTEALYPVKLWSEDAQLTLTQLTSDERGRLQLLIQFSQRRLQELASAAMNDETSQAVQTRLEEQMNQAAAIARQIGDMDGDTAATLAQLKDQADHARRKANQPQPSPPAPTMPAPEATAIEMSAPTLTPTPPPPTTVPPALSATPLPPEPLPPATPATAIPDPDAIREQIRLTVTVLPRSPRPIPPGLPATRAALPVPAWPTQVAPPVRPPVRPDVRETVESVRATVTALPSPPRINPDDIRAKAQAIRQTAEAFRPPSPPGPPGLPDAPAPAPPSLPTAAPLPLPPTQSPVEEASATPDTTGPVPVPTAPPTPPTALPDTPPTEPPQPPQPPRQPGPPPRATPAP